MFRLIIIFFKLFLLKNFELYNLVLGKLYLLTLKLCRVNWLTSFSFRLKVLFNEFDWVKFFSEGVILNLFKLSSYNDKYIFDENSLGQIGL